MHSWTQRLLAAATTGALLLLATCVAASSLDAFHVPYVDAQVRVCLCPLTSDAESRSLLKKSIGF